MQRTMFLAIILLGLAATPSWTQDPVASSPVSPPAPPVAKITESPAPAAVKANPSESELLEQELRKFVGRWRHTSLNEHRVEPGGLAGMKFERKGNELEVTSLLSQIPPDPATATLEIADAPKRIRRIKIVTKMPNSELKELLAVYEFSSVDGSNDNPPRLKMNYSHGGKYPTSMDERGKGIEQLECEYILPSEGALGIPASAIPGKVWITSATAIVAIADDGKSAAAYCEQHPTWVSIPLDSTITALPTPVADSFDVAVQHGPQCHAYSMSLGTWSTLTLPAGEEAVANLEPFPSGASVDFKRHSRVSVHSKTQGEYVFKDEWGKWFSAEEIKAGKVAEHLATLKVKSGETGAPPTNATVSPEAKPEVTPENAKQLEQDLARFAGHWTLIRASHAQERPDDINRISFYPKDDHLFAAFVEPGVAGPATKVRLEVSNAPDRIRRIQFLGDASISGSKSFLAVYEFSPAEGPTDGPLRLKLNISKNGTWPTSMNDLGENYFQMIYLKLPATEALSSPQAANPALSITKIFSLQHTQATDVMELLKQLYDQAFVKIAVDTRTNSVIAIGPPQKLEEIETLIKRLDEAVPAAPPSTVNTLTNEAAELVVPLEDERVKLLQSLGDKHPKIEKLDARLAQARSHVAGPASPPFKEVLRQQMEQALGELLQAKGTEDQSIQDAKAKIETILAEFDKAPYDTRRDALTHIASMEDVALGLRDEEFARWQGAREETKEKDPIYLALKKHRFELRQKGQNRQPFPFANSLTNISPSEGRLVIQEIIVELQRESAKLVKHLEKDEQRIAQLDNTVGKIIKEYLQLVAELDETELEELSQTLKANYLAWLKTPTFPRIIRDTLDQKLKETGVADEALMRDLAVSVVFERYRNWERESLAQPKPTNSPVKESSTGGTHAAELQMLPYVQACLAELKSERDEIIQRDGKDHPEVAHFNASVAELEAKIQEIQTNGKAESDQYIGEMKQALGMLPESIERMRLERNNLVKSDPQNPRIRELDMHIAATKVMQRQYSGVIAAHEAGDASPLPLSRSLHTNGTKASADLPQLRKDYSAAEAEAQRLAEQLRQPGSTASKDELKKTVKEAFTLRQSLLRAELSEMLDRLAKTQHSIDLRDRITDQIVTRRVEELLNPQLEWGDSKSGTQPETPSASLKESAPNHPQEWTTKLQGHWQLMQHTYEQVDTSDGKKPQPGDVKRENWNPETYYRKQTTPWKAMFDGHQMSICKEDGSDPMTFELSFRKAGPPQQVDLTMELSQADLAELKQMVEETQSSTTLPTFKGIIEETPDGFRMCLDLKGTGTRPFLFVLGPDTGLWEFRREAAAPPTQFQEQAATQEFLPPAKGRPPEKNSNSSEIKAANPSQLTALQMTSLFNAILQRHPMREKRRPGSVQFKRGNQPRM